MSEVKDMDIESSSTTNTDVKARQYELDRLVTAMVAQAPTDCLLADMMLEVLDLNAPIRPCPMASISDQTPRLHGTRFYPPIYRRGPIKDHDRPFAEYGHTDSAALCQLCKFDFAGKKMKKLFEQHHGPVPKRSICSWAIQCFSRCTKSEMIEHINGFSISENDPLQYVCIAEPIFDLRKAELYCLSIQIIFKKRKIRRLNFLDRYAVGLCNYLVTRNELAWNEYLKKNHNFLEVGNFKSHRILEPLYWYHPAPPTTSGRRRKKPIITMSDERFRCAQLIAQRVMIRAIDHVRDALRSLCMSNPSEYIRYKQWFLLTCQYIHLREQHEVQSDQDEQHGGWPASFPHCSMRLRQTIDHWLQNEFVKKEHAKCLILIGPRGCGKSTFARSLPGPVNYFDDTSTDMKSWSNYARYAVYDNIEWDQFEVRNYPDRKRLLTQSGTVITIDDFFLDTIQIRLNQPSIVLLTTDETEGSLKALYDPSMPLSDTDRMNAHTWPEHAIIYRLGHGDHFYLSPSMDTDDLLPATPESTADHDMN